MMIAFLTLMDRVPTGSAMAFAASVEPFTKMEPITRAITMARKGFDANTPTNWENVAMVVPFSQNWMDYNG
jgi:hypothetical protein